MPLTLTRSPHAGERGEGTKAARQGSFAPLAGRRWPAGRMRGKLRQPIAASYRRSGAYARRGNPGLFSCNWMSIRGRVSGFAR
ncbi:hypothetical protein EPK84_26470 [Sinorhizobium fredii]|nr:hypothetical protein EPK84_26470 [Sinorhizobium fredii]